MENDTISEEDFAYRRLTKLIDGYLTLYAYPLIFVFGMMGNLLMFVLMYQHEFQRTSTSLFMRAMAVTDSLYLVGRVFQLFLFYVAPGILRPGDHLYGVCTQYGVLFTYAQAGSLLLLMAMTFERAHAIVFPLKSIASAARKRARNLTLLVLVLTAFWAFPFVVARRYMPELAEQGWSCPFFFPTEIARVLQSVESSCGYAACILLTLANLVILKAVFASRQRRKQMTNDSKTAESKNDDGILIMLVIVSITYLIPYALPRMKNVYYFNYPAVTVRQKANAFLIARVTLTIEHCSFACNFYLYALPMRKFRTVLFRIVRRLFRCSDSEGRSAAVSMTMTSTVN